MPPLHEVPQQGREGRTLGGPKETSPEALGQLITRTGQPLFFTNRLCPYAHRVWWALEEKGVAAEVDYIHIELGQNKPGWYQKYVNPYGTVPCLYVDGKGVFESPIICEFVEDKWPDRGTKLMPDDPHDRAAIRLLISHFNERTIPPLYRCLKAQTPAEVRLTKEIILVEMLALEAVYAKHTTQGPFFLGTTFSLAEVMIFPFIERMCVALKFYRGLDPLVDADLPSLQAAFEAVKQRPAHKKTTQAPEFYVQVYDHYANPLPQPVVPSVASVPAGPEYGYGTGEGKRSLARRIAAFLKAPAAVPIVAFPVILSTATFLLGCGLGWGAAKGPGRHGGHIKY